MHIHILAALRFVGIMAAGALVTTSAEYFFKYNLLDYIIEGLKHLFGHAEQAVVSEAKKVELKVESVIHKK